MNALPVTARDRLAKLLGMLGSDHMGERDAAAVAAHRLVVQSGLTWRQVIEPPAIEKRLPELGTWRATVAARLRGPDRCGLGNWASCATCRGFGGCR